MTPRARKLVALGFAAIGFFVVATYRPFGGSNLGDPVRVHDPRISGYATGLECGLRLAMEDIDRLKTPKRIAAYIAQRNEIARDQREAWCTAFAEGFRKGMQERTQGGASGSARSEYQHKL